MDHTFANFVVGPSNQFAHAAAYTVATQSSVAYNPLVIAGGDGLGKTHLLHAIGHQRSQRELSCRIIYCHAEAFMQEMLSALHNGRMESFRKQYLQTDMLLMDDIQFLAGKNHTQEVFAHVFNTLFDAGKQIVVGSNPSPQELTTLETRLRSRLLAGLIAIIQPPDFETRLAMLYRQAAAHRIILPEGAARRLAAGLHTDVRALENGLARLIAYASLHSRSIDETLVDMLLQQTRYEHERDLSIPRIQRLVATHFACKLSDLKARKRQQKFILPRQIAMFLCRELTAASLPEIGRSFGDRDHATVSYACTKIARMADNDVEVAGMLSQLRQLLQL